MILCFFVKPANCINTLNQSMTQRRSSEQHNVEWWYYRHIADHIGQTTYDVYLALSYMISKELDPDGNTVIRCPNWMSVSEHYSYIQRVIVIASEIGLILPTPDEARTMAMEDLNMSRYKTLPDSD